MQKNSVTHSHQQFSSSGEQFLRASNQGMLLFRDEIIGFGAGQREGVNAFRIAARVAKWLYSFGKKIAGKSAWHKGGFCVYFFATYFFILLYFMTTLCCKELQAWFCSCWNKRKTQLFVYRQTKIFMIRRRQASTAVSPAHGQPGQESGQPFSRGEVLTVLNRWLRGYFLS